MNTREKYTVILWFRERTEEGITARELPFDVQTEYGPIDAIIAARIRARELHGKIGMPYRISCDLTEGVK